MHIQPILDALERSPFKPFEIETVSGRIIPIQHPDFILFTASRNTMVATEGEHVYVLGINEVASLNYRPREKAPQTP